MDEGRSTISERFLDVDRARVSVSRSESTDRLGDGRAADAARAAVLALCGQSSAAQGPRDAAAAWSPCRPDRASTCMLTGEARDVQRSRRRATRRIVFLGEFRAMTSGATYAGACAYVHPALLEGFGLPMLEAMRHGTPVIASDASAVRSRCARTCCVSRSRCCRVCARLLDAGLADPAQMTQRAAAGQVVARELTWERDGALDRRPLP